MHHNPPETFIHAYQHIAKYPLGLKPHLTGILAPTLIIGGDHDQFFSVERFQETKDLIPNAQLILFKGRGHPVPLEKPRQVINIIASFLID